MKREILYIANQEVDIIPNTINRNLQINDFGNAEDRQSSYSNTVKLPMTSNNRKVFNFLGVSGNTSRSPYKQLPCTYTVDGIPLITNGYAEVKASSDAYEVVLYDGVIDLAERLKGKKLNDLSYGDINHYLNRQTYEDSFTNTSGFIYALGDFGFESSSIKAERQMPSVYVHTLWDKIFKEAGVNYVGDFFTSNEDFLSEVVTPPIGYDPQNSNTTVTSIGACSTNIISRFETSQDITYYSDTFDFNTTFSSSDFAFVGNEIHVINDIAVQIDLDINYNVYESNVTFRILKNEGAIEYITLPNNSNDTLSESITVSLKAGDKLKLELRGAEHPTSYPDENISGGGGLINSYSVDYNADVSISFSEVSGGFLIDFSELMGDMDCTTFVKDVMQRYGLVLKPIKNSADYEFIRFEKLLTDKGNAEDWSDKFSSVEKEDYRSKYAQLNRAKYKYPEEIQSPVYDGIISISDDNLDGEKTFFSSPYEVAQTKVKKIQTPLYFHPVWSEKDGEIKVEDAPIKVFRIKKVSESLSYTYFDDASAYSYTGDIPFLSYEKMDMQYFLNTNYKAYGQVLDNYKEVDATLLLNELDIYNVDFFKLKYLNQTGKYYYCQKIKHKTGNKASKVSLIEINEFLENLPVQTLGEYTRNTGYSGSGDVRLSYLTTQTTPAYYDPESDEPYAVKFISGYNSQVKLYQDGVEITDDTEILVSDWNVTFEDLETTTDAHEHSFEFQIRDAGSKEYSSAVGTFTISVYEYQNQPPIADAGEDDTLLIDTQSTQTSYFIGVSGSGSTDNTGNITSYSWAIISKPVSSSAILSNFNTSNASLEIPNEFESRGTYRLELTVTDEFGLTGTDTVDITVNEELKAN